MNLIVDNFDLVSTSRDDGDVAPSHSFDLFGKELYFMLFDYARDDLTMTHFDLIM